jgi:putative ABC transport system permease protein
MTHFGKPGNTGRATRLPLLASAKLAYRNILRHRMRTATTVAAITFGVAALVLSQGFVEDIFVQLAEAVVHSQTGHIQLATQGYFAHGAHRPLQFLLPDPEGDKAAIRKLNGVEDVMARLNFPGLLNNGRADLAVLVEGVEPAKEAKLGTFVHFSAGRALGPADRYHAVVGHGVARSLNVKPGDNLTLVVSTADGAMNTVDVQLVGVFQSFSKEYDNRAVKLPLPTAQELLTTRGANVLIVSLRRTDDTERIAGLLRDRAAQHGQEVKTWSDLNDFHRKTVLLYDRQFGGLLLIILLMVLLSVVNSVNMTVFERTGEFGTARALGNRRRDIFHVVMLENVLLGIGGSVLGAVIGVLLAKLISLIGIPMPPPPNADLSYVAYVRVTPPALLGALAIGFGATVLAAVIPALRVSRMNVALALRQST